MRQLLSVKFIAAILTILLTIGLEFQFRIALPSLSLLSLSALLTISFFFPPLRVLFLSCSAALILNWQPSMSSELVLLITLPLFVVLCRRVVPLAPWTSTILFNAGGTLLFFGTILSSLGWSFVKTAHGWHLLRLALLATFANVAFGLVLFFIFTYAFPKKA